MKNKIPSRKVPPFQGSINNLSSGKVSPSQGDHRGSGSYHYTSSPLLIGSLPLGGDYPIRLQSMTNTDTMDTRASVAQCIRIIEAGGDLVRLTAQGVREAQNLAFIKEELRKSGFNTPLIADIHFNPAAAETAARLVEKVRINPGNYTDKRAAFIKVDFTEKEYNEELERIHSRLLPLINICRENGTVIRVGINHGSLSDRIMTRFGNTPEGMVQSALEFIDIFRKENFGNLVLSMKSSDTDVMIRSTRLLVAAMQDKGIAYPVHLGVTEAGEGEDGRIRSAAGIGALLQDGIGDTIRVSLSEDPEKEIPVAKKLAEFFPRKLAVQKHHEPVSYTSPDEKPELFRKVIGPLVFADFRYDDPEPDWLKAGFGKDATGNITRTDSSADLIILPEMPAELPEQVRIAIPYELWKKIKRENVFPLFTSEDLTSPSETSDLLNIVLSDRNLNTELLRQFNPGNTLVVYSFDAGDPYEPLAFMTSLHEKRMQYGIILNPRFSDDKGDDLNLRAAGTLGSYLTDRRISGIVLSRKAGAGSDELTGIAFSILQCTDKRITRTIYLSCPTCGRTKFNLQETVKKVKSATGHLKGLKIAVMGCIVNGPGEMAGADYGYVGAAPGKVHIYKGMNPVLKNVPEEEAINELLRVIKGDS